MAVIKDVAKLAGVSIGTVSRYMNNPDSLKEETKKRVHSAVTELDYTPSLYARSLRTRRTNMIALVVRDLSNYFFVELYNAVKIAAAELGYFVLLFTTQEDKGILKDFLRNPGKINADGIIFAYLDEGEFADSLSLVQQTIPTTLITWDVNNVNSDAVVVDLCESIYIATRHLIELGRERIAYLSGIPGVRVSEEKYRGFKRAMREAKLPIREDYFYEGTYVFGTGFRGARHFAMLEERPDGVVCANDIIAIGCIKYLTQKNITVPNEIAVTGLNNILLSKILEPTLTTVAIPIEEMGREAANLLIETIEKKNHKTRQILLNTHLIARNSTLAGSPIDFEF